MDAAKLTSDVLRVAGEILNENVGPKLMDKVIELRKLTLELQSLNAELQCRNVALQEEVHALKRELLEAKDSAKRVKDWDSLAEQFKLQYLDGGVLVRRGRHKNRPDEPVHNLCPTCFEAQKYSPFQRATYKTRPDGYFLDTFVCQICKSSFDMLTRHHVC